MPRRLALLGVLALLLGSAPAARAGLHAGDTAPEFRGTDLTGVSRRLSDYHGSKVVVLFVLGNT